MAHERITDKLHRRHVRLFRILSWICAPLFRRKMNYSWDDLSGIEGPYVLVCNHNTDYDPILLGLAASKQLYFVAGEQVTRNGFLFKLLDFVFAPIIHFKGKAGINTVSQMLRDLKSGYSVAIFPEGNRSFNGLTCSFAPTIGKLIRKSGAGLITYRLEGGYFTQPRWGFTLRRGKLNGRLMRYFDPEKLAGMTDDEINDAIKHDLYENAYETQSRERVPFKGKKMALGLETTLFMCPKCGKRAALFSTNDELKCSCGYSARFTEYGELIRTDESAPDKAAVTIAQLDTAQREALKAEVSEARQSGNHHFLFEDEVNLMRIGSDHRIASTETLLMKAYTDHVELGDTVLAPSDISGMALVYRNTITAYHSADGGQYEIKGTNVMFNALKYLYLYECFKASE